MNNNYNIYINNGAGEGCFRHKMAPANLFRGGEFELLLGPNQYGTALCRFSTTFQPVQQLSVNCKITWSTHMQNWLH